MATTDVTLVADTWTEVSTADCYFHNMSGKPIYVSSAQSIASIDGKILIRPYECNVFEIVTSGDILYAMSPGEVGSISFDLK